MKKLIAISILLLCSHAQAVIIYDVTFTGLNTGAGSGAGTVGFNDDALDFDGVFDTSSGIASLDITIDGFSFTLADLSLSAQVDYEVLGGALAGFDWSADTNVATLGGSLPGPLEASSLSSTMNLFSLFAPCPAGICEYEQSWVRRGGNMTVAEPASVLLIGAGLLGLGFRRKTTRKQVQPTAAP